MPPTYSARSSDSRSFIKGRYLVGVIHNVEANKAYRLRLCDVLQPHLE
jgi:hypothetical protein